jgi:protein-tyrosine kinase
MTRLADALQRADIARQPASTPPVEPPGPAVARKTAAATSVAPARLLVPRPAASPLQFGGTKPLLVPPSGRLHSPAWRTDPLVVGKLVGTPGCASGALEQYRKLAATLHHAQEERGIQVVMTASSLPGEGKSLTAVNLALTLSESYQRTVLLIDADLRRPTIHRVFGIDGLSGLDEGLKSEKDAPMSLVSITERLLVLPAGRPDPDPLSGLASERMRRLVAEARLSFDWILIDTPPVSLLPDASLITACVDGVLLVVRSGKASYHLVKRTVDALGHQRILGVVMNAVDFAHDRNAGGYYEYYGYGYDGSAQK